MKASPPTAIRLRLTPAGRTLLPVAGAGLLASWIAGGSAGFLTVLVASVLVLAFPLTWFAARGLRIALPARHFGTAQELLRCELDVTNTNLVLGTRELVITAGASRREDPRPIGALARCDAGSQVRVPIEFRLRERGRMRRLELALLTRAPLYLVSLQLQYQLAVDIWALPRRDPWSVRDPEPKKSREYRARKAERRAEEEFYGVREWRNGENPRRIHWKLSARRDDLVLREYRAPGRPPIHLHLALHVEDSSPWRGRHPGFERVCRLAATLGERYLQQGREVRFSFLDPDPPAPFVYRGRRGLRALLMTLSELHCRPGDPWRDVARFRPRTRQGEWNIICLAGRGVRPTQDATSQAAWILDVEDPEYAANLPPMRPALRRESVYA